MAAYRRGKKGTWYLRVPTPDGKGVVRSADTPDADVVADYEDALAAMRRKRLWPALAAVARGRLPLDQCRDAWARGDVAALAQLVDDVDLQDHVAGWQATLRTRFAKTGRRKQNNSRPVYDRYLTILRTLLVVDGAGRPVPFRASQFTAAAVSAWVASRPVENATRVYYRAAASSFAQYLVSIGVLAANPVRGTARPKPADPRTRHLDIVETERLLAALPEPYRTAAALAHGTGMEMAALIHLRRRDVHLAAGTVHAHGTKTKWRDRTVHVDAWALPALERHVRTLTPDAVVFPAFQGPQGHRRMEDAMRRACRAVGIEDYTIHDARHSFAVRYLAAGAASEFVRAQLGHKTTRQVDEVYGAFKATPHDVARYQRLAAARDAETQAEAERARHAHRAEPAEVVDLSERRKATEGP